MIDEGIKYDSSIIERFDVFEKEFGIEELNISVFQSESYSGDSAIEVIGEVISEKINDDMIVAITVHNECGEVIGTDFSENIERDNFEGIHTFSKHIIVAADEEINKVRVYAIKDPSVIW